MKRIMQSLKTGATELLETPCPKNQPGHLLIQTTRSLISPGTEKMLVDFGKASLLDKVRQQPDKVRMVFDKVKTDGLLPTIEAVQNKLEQMLPMGYCNVGTVLEVGEGVTGFSVGDRVVSNGAHAEVICVPKNLCCKIPDSVTDDEAVFTVLGAIALQGIRLSQPTIGEAFVVMGLGLIGLLTVQLLRAQGCRVLGIDFDEKKLALAAQFGAETINLSQQEDPVVTANTFSRERGVDAVLITAATRSSEPVHHAAQMCRKRGRIILVGVTGLELSRADFYEKELSFQVSCSYGPGRYDSSYELKGHDYPIGFVRWTEQRNFEAVLDLLQSKKLSVDALISAHYPLNSAEQVYQQLGENQLGLGCILEYNAENPLLHVRSLQINSKKTTKATHVSIGFIGAGNYAGRTLLPAFKKSRAVLSTIACSGGVRSTQLGKKFGFEKVTTDIEDIFANPEINTVVIATRHDSHAELICRAMQAKKHVFVEKPLCLTFAELENITSVCSVHTDLHLMVGFNRRFSPHIIKMKQLLRTLRTPKSFIMTVNAGEVPASQWTQDSAIGGGRLIGEACHFIDLLRFLAGAPITQFHVTRLDNILQRDDKASITLSFADGSFGVIHYLANGHKSFPKERLEVFSAGKILQLDNFRQLRGFGWGSFKKMSLWRQDKGQMSCVAEFLHAIKSGTGAPIAIAELIEVSRVTLEAARGS